ncbi:MAG TPA: nuclear transport factor 2 family protein [Pyrinomonadaceae bacterium]|jgi:ketosteroid isomerase-like protein|nr:nuclear transport factor 2 family protein [Pyrinomonadaceae bacterium]
MCVKIALFGFLLGVASIVQGQSALQEMVKTEQAFSKMAEEKNTRDAFMAFIADDGLLFRPGAVNGKKWMTEHPVPPSDKRPLLAWQPAYAKMARAGDLGFTTGPWEFKNDINDKSPSGYGHFVTLWKKQADGSWKFVVDLGITHPQSGGPQTLWHPSDDREKPNRFAVPTIAKHLIAQDRKYSDLAKLGVYHAFVTFAAEEIRLYRAGSLPFVGIESASKAFTSIKGQPGWQPAGGDVSRSGDLGYTYGTYEIADDTYKVIEKGSYVHIWKKNKFGLWRVVLDVANPH